MLGRRGPAEAAFTAKEVKEIGSLEDADLIVTPQRRRARRRERALAGREGNAGRQAQRRVPDREEPRAAARARSAASTSASWSPPSSSWARTARCSRSGSSATSSTSTPTARRARAAPARPGSSRSSWRLTAVGYRGVPIAGCPFDERGGIVPNVEGRLLGADGATLPGLYAVGWAKRGPTGLIGDNVADAEETVRHMLEDLARDVVVAGRARRGDRERNGGAPRRRSSACSRARGVRWVSLRRLGASSTRSRSRAARSWARSARSSRASSRCSPSCQNADYAPESRRLGRREDGATAVPGSADGRLAAIHAAWPTSAPTSRSRPRSSSSST